MTRNNFKGTGVAMVTPFNQKGAIDFEALKRLIDYMISNGVDYLVSMGTTGESATMDQAEKFELLKQTRSIINKRVPLVLGLGGNNTAAVTNLFTETDLEGVDAILSVSPYYNKPSQEGIYHHYKTLSEATELPIILYNVPGRTGTNILASTTIRLANTCPNIIAIKEASGDLIQAMYIRKDVPDDFLIISGEDALTLPMISSGGNGVISVLGNALPKAYSDLVRFALNGDFEAATKIQLSILEIIRLLFADGNPGGVKAALHILGICGDHVRLPLFKANNEIYKGLEKELNSLGLLD